jgi:hypothetical protein
MDSSNRLQINSGKSMAPFAIEKAVHNIMFIKHHMKRQDEFDAVSFVQAQKPVHAFMCSFRKFQPIPWRNSIF